MNNRVLGAVLLASILILTTASQLCTSLSEEVNDAEEHIPSRNFETSYTFNVYNGHFKYAHTLYVSIPSSLYDYYNMRSHVVASEADYTKFVTPNAFSDVACSIKKTIEETSYSDEQFANAVLSLVHQISYIKSATKYPVEALVENSGDCDVLSLLAASIMKAGGLDVVLLYYKDINPSHMNLGVFLPYKPIYQSWWLTPKGFEYDNKTYWMAECTSQGDWRVGDEPSLLAGTKPHVIPLRGTGRIAPAQVSSSLHGQLAQSSVSATIALDNSNLEGENRSLEITGEIIPASAGKNVTMYVGRERLAFEAYRTVTDENGRYSFTWNFTQSGKYTITTSLVGTAEYAGSDSESLTVFPGVYEPIFSGQYFDSGPSSYFGSLLSQNTKYVLRSNASGAGLLLSGEFMIINENDTGAPLIEVKIPKTERIVFFPKTRQTMRVVIREEQVISVPAENNQLGFILRHDGDENYSASIGVLGEQQISKITKTLQESSSAYMNASDVAGRNKWYKVEAKISENTTNAKLYEINNTLLDNLAATEPPQTEEMGVLMSYPPNSILAFKNLKVAALGETDTPVPSNEEQPQESKFGWTAPYIIGTILLAIGCTAVYCTAKKKSNQARQA